jgi:rRNA biogenesis protein RRP5
LATDGRPYSETGVVNLSESFVVGKVVKVRIISVNPEELRIQASICQASPNFESPATDVSNIEISDVVEGAVTDIHETNAVLSLHATGARALISLKNIANHRGKSVAELRSSLKQGDKLEDLVVVTRNPEKGFVIVAHKSQRKTALPTKASISMDTLTVGQIVMGRVTGHTQRGAVVKLSSHVSGFLHPTDTTDNYEAGNPFPTKDSVMKVVVVHIDREAKSLALSTRGSRMHPGQDSPVADREIQSLADLKGGDTVRGFIKSVAEHGLFVTLGRGIDARVQIKELFDEVRRHFDIMQLLAVS